MVKILEKKRWLYFIATLIIFMGVFTHKASAFYVNGLDFSDTEDTYSFDGVSKYGDLNTKGWELTKPTLHDYVLKLKNLEVIRIVLPKDDADKNKNLFVETQPRETHVTVVLEGNNVIKDGLFGQSVKGLTITGDGNLTVGGDSAINSFSDLTIEENVGTINLNAYLDGIYSTGNVTIKGGKFNIKGKRNAIITKEDLTVENADINAEATDYDENVIEVYKKFTADKSEFTLKGGQFGLRAADINIKDSTFKDEGVKASDKSIVSREINNQTGNITLNNINLDMKGVYGTIDSGNSLYIHGGNIKAANEKGRAQVIEAAQDIIIDNGAVVDILSRGNGLAAKRSDSLVKIAKGVKLTIDSLDRSVLGDDAVDGYGIFSDEIYIENGADLDLLGPKRVFSKKPTFEEGPYYIEAGLTASNLLQARYPEAVSKETAARKYYYYRYIKTIYSDDTEKPIITGKNFDNGATYCFLPTLTVTDDSPIDFLTINGSEISKFEENKTNKKVFIVPASDEPKKEIVVKDIMGNTETKTITAYNYGCPKSILGSRVTLSTTNYYYDGSEKKPSVTVTYNNKNLINGVDYTLEYKNNINAGTATVTVVGKNNYTGRIEKNFTISKKANTITASDITTSYSNKTKTLKINAKQAGNSKITYTSNNSKVQINNSGNVSINSGYVGTTTIKIATIENEGYLATSKNIVLKVNKLNNSISASNVTKNYSNNAQSFNLNAKQVGDAKLSYTSNTSYVTVDNQGKVTVKPGFVGLATINIKASATTGYNEANKKVTVNVNKVNNSIIASNFTKVASTKSQSFNINARQVGNSKLTYSSNNKSVSVNGSGRVTIKAGYSGKATITITANASNAYNKASKNITVVVNPASVKISKLSNSGRKKMTVKWTKNKNVTGYQIQYSTSSNFKKSVKTVNISKNKTVSKVISKLSKGKKYYVRIRTYKTEGKTKYYSSWSSTKSIKIKK